MKKILLIFTITALLLPQFANANTSDDKAFVSITVDGSPVSASYVLRMEQTYTRQSGKVISESETYPCYDGQCHVQSMYKEGPRENADSLQYFLVELSEKAPSVKEHFFTPINWSTGEGASIIDVRTWEAFDAHYDEFAQKDTAIDVTDAFITASVSEAETIVAVDTQNASATVVQDEEEQESVNAQITNTQNTNILAGAAIIFILIAVAAYIKTSSSKQSAS